MLQELWGRAHSISRGQKFDRNGKIRVNKYAYWLRVVAQGRPGDYRPRFDLFLARITAMVRSTRPLQERKVQQHQAQEEGGDYRRALHEPAPWVQRIYELLSRTLFHRRTWLSLHTIAVRGLHGATCLRSPHSWLHMEQKPSVLGKADTQRIDDESHQEGRH